MVLEVESGPRKGSRIELKPGDVLEIGRRGKDFAITEDLAMSGQHFLVKCAGDGRITLRDLNSANGTILNSVKVGFAELKEGDRIQAGNTAFTLRTAVAAVASPAGDGLISELDGEPLAILRSQKEQLYAILDAARAPAILELLRDFDDEYQSLYNGKSAEDLAEYAPYLVRLQPQSELLESLISEGWGDSWGIYLACDRPLAEVRKHFRHFLMIEVEGRQVYFRFYDPRVLSIFLPTCRISQQDEFFGPVQTFLTEAAGKAGLLEFHPPRVRQRGTAMSSG